MPFTINDVRDLVQLLEQHPEWRAEVRRLVLTEELLGLPQVVRELADGLRQTQQDLRALTEEVRALADAQRQTQQDLRALTEEVRELAGALRQTQQDLSALTVEVRALAEEVRLLADAQLRTEEVVRDLAASVRRLENDVGRLKGSDLERRYRERPFAYFSGLIRRARALTPDDLQGLLDQALARGQLAADEIEEVMLADVVVRGLRREDGAEVYLVVEASWGIAAYDVERAARRAGLLARADVQAVPVVAGAELIPEARQLAHSAGVAVVTDGILAEPPGDGGSV